VPEPGALEQRDTLSLGLASPWKGLTKSSTNEPTTALDPLFDEADCHLQRHRPLEDRRRLEETSAHDCADAVSDGTTPPLGASRARI
jgi:hypothetical protein